jgi:hypothetical protein
MQAALKFSIAVLAAAALFVTGHPIPAGILLALSVIPLCQK